MQNFSDMLNESLNSINFKRFFEKVDFSKTHTVKHDHDDIFIDRIVINVVNEGTEDADTKQEMNIFKKNGFPVKDGETYVYGSVNLEYEFINGNYATIKLDYYYDPKSKKTLVFKANNKPNIGYNLV